MVSGLTACTGTVTGVGGEPGQPPGDDDGDDAPPLPGQPDAAPPLPGQPDAAPPPQADPLVAGIHMDEIALFQSVAVPLARKGVAVSPRNATIVEGRDAMLSITFEIDDGFVARPIEARVEIDGTAFTTSQTVSASSGDSPTASLHVKVPGEAIKTSSTIAVSLHEAAGASAQPGDTSGARYPEQGTVALGAKSVNGTMHLVLVPFRYGADGSGRLPPTDAASVAAHKAAFQAMYPVADMDVTVHAPVDTNITIQSSDSWSAWLDELDGVRQADNPPDNTYYFGLSSPASSFGAFCNGSCIVGLGHVPGANNSFLFGAVGVSFSGNLLSGTALHEIGHTMGRQHVDCGGPSGIDPNFPYEGGAVGVWGYDAVNDKLKDPGTFTDIMGYCNRQWISDYEYEAIYQRLARVNGASFTKLEVEQAYRVGTVDGRGVVTWRRVATLDRLPQGDVRHVSLRDQDGTVLGNAEGTFFAYDHMPGGTIYMPIDGLLDTTSIAPAATTVVY
jgi:hypothetical protein